uniref:Uncharacterized protein n=1 Tax=Rhizophora mucronata TaxID=61149 RepID=A0A2P2NQ63_RHIMU
MSVSLTSSINFSFDELLLSAIKAQGLSPQRG